MKFKYTKSGYYLPADAQTWASSVLISFGASFLLYVFVFVALCF